VTYASLSVTQRVLINDTQKGIRSDAYLSLRKTRPVSGYALILPTEISEEPFFCRATDGVLRQPFITTAPSNQDLYRATRFVEIIHVLQEGVFVESDHGFVMRRDCP